MTNIIKVSLTDPANLLPQENLVGKNNRLSIGPLSVMTAGTAEMGEGLLRLIDKAIPVAQTIIQQPPTPVVHVGSAYALHLNDPFSVQSPVANTVSASSNMVSPEQITALTLSLLTFLKTLGEKYRIHKAGSELMREENEEEFLPKLRSYAEMNEDKAGFLPGLKRLVIGRLHGAIPLEEILNDSKLAHDIKLGEEPVARDRIERAWLKNRFVLRGKMGLAAAAAIGIMTGSAALGILVGAPWVAVTVATSLLVFTCGKALLDVYATRGKEQLQSTAFRKILNWLKPILIVAFLATAVVGVGTFPIGGPAFISAVLMLVLSGVLLLKYVTAAIWTRNGVERTRDQYACKNPAYDSIQGRQESEHEEIPELNDGYEVPISRANGLGNKLSLLSTPPSKPPKLIPTRVMPLIKGESRGFVMPKNPSFPPIPEEEENEYEEIPELNDGYEVPISRANELGNKPSLPSIPPPKPPKLISTRVVSLIKGRSRRFVMSKNPSFPPIPEEEENEYEEIPELNDEYEVPISTANRLAVSNKPPFPPFPPPKPPIFPRAMTKAEINSIIFPGLNKIPSPTAEAPPRPPRTLKKNNIIEISPIKKKTLDRGNLLGRLIQKVYRKKISPSPRSALGPSTILEAPNTSSARQGIRSQESELARQRGATHYIPLSQLEAIFNSKEPA